MREIGQVQGKPHPVQSHHVSLDHDAGIRQVLHDTPSLRVHEITTFDIIRQGGIALHDIHIFVKKSGNLLQPGNPCLRIHFQPIGWKRSLVIGLHRRSRKIRSFIFILDIHLGLRLCTLVNIHGKSVTGRSLHPDFLTDSILIVPVINRQDGG